MAGNKLHSIWKDWFNQQGHRFLLFAKQQSRNPFEAEDILQDSVVKLIKTGYATSIPEDRVIYRTIRNMAIDYARSNIRRIKREEIAYELSGASAHWFDYSIEQKEQQQKLEQAVQKLTKEQQEVVTLKIWGEQTFQQIAEVLSISANTAASRYRYGLKNLQQMIQTQSKEDSLR